MEQNTMEENVVKASETEEKAAVGKTVKREKKEDTVEIPAWDRIRSKAYRRTKAIIRACYPRIKTGGAHKLPDEPAIIIMNHSHANGPIATELYYPRRVLTWATGEMFDQKEFPDYAMNIFFFMAPEWSKRLINRICLKMAPVVESVFKSANLLPVYLDARILSTFRQTVEALHQNYDIVIFPENDDPYNQILNQFHPNFVDVAKRYYRQYKKEIPFVPVYLCPKLKSMYFGEPIYFNHENKIDMERERVVAYLQKEITRMAESLPEHVVIPFNAKPRKEYRKNTDRVTK